jgi:NAD(P)-dependent dehydrogenase (short-subunit alcohol dehydrogenase family)
MKTATDQHVQTHPRPNKRTQVAIITGAASGIGRHWAGVLAVRDDFVLALADIDEAGAAAAFTPSDRLRLRRLDVRSPGDWQALLGDTLAAFGRIDYLFNIAGGGRLGFLLEQTVDNVVDTPLARRHFDHPEAAALARSGGRVLTVQDVEAAFWQAMTERPLEINLPRWRGWLAKVNSLYPPLMLRLYEPLKRRGLKRLEHADVAHDKSS